MRFFFIILLLMLTISCSNNNTKTLYNFKDNNIKRETISDSEIKLSSAEIIKKFNKKIKEYKLKQGDIIELIPNDISFSKLELKITPDGKINLKDIGEIIAENKTIFQLQNEINKKLLNYYDNLNYIINLKQGNNSVYVWGNIAKPGEYKSNYEDTLIKILTKAGGINLNFEDLMDTKIYCKIIRKNEAIVIDLVDMIINNNLIGNVYLNDNDIIYVSIDKIKEKNIYVYGEITRAGKLEYEKNLTLIDVILRSGGFTKNSDLEKVYYIHKNDKKYDIRVLNFKNIKNINYNKLIVKPGDMVFVEKNNMSNFNDFLINVLEPLKAINLFTDTAVNINNLK
ncbi:protein involved in polysaccharide export with SLBB domain [Hypnocyclicus thermotrophus]|uniref:Protein involved in polysaccharide export with SLBB domain n=1 Tax=Hypnocyclicus thermotrophus TaxID=1627895 RepID=A0AA46E0B1_9FUSO|nr:SLBB domain-containing protein [Hypnocyclicus thermotrophus]TDT72440.1 protein involved in polysaccharide export with SLBB domain [Hypnocyclicus thermotrophus]